ncbi:MAG: LysM peptidoglycan-binding domain-containing protein, partial [Flavobacteriales bacterium]|nr:LysM peptidoglycan-binding domain-containing protein [Flavobacteriales bacterium]
PRLTETLTIGDRLLIPLNKITRRDLDEAPDIDGNFLIHQVQKKNTLYSIAKEYNLEINDIILQNPEVENGLKKGMRLKIPVAKIKSEVASEEYVVPAAASPYVTHQVAPKETLYSLSKLYEVSIDSISLVNNGLPGGLKEGELINMPILKTYKNVILQTIQFDSASVKTSYKIALLLPFYLDLMELAEETIDYKTAEEINKEIRRKAKYAIEFYQGFKLGAEELALQGLNLELSVLDTGNDSTKVQEILTGKELQDVDLIVGPLYLDNFLMVSDFAKRNHINIVSPVKLSNKVLLGNSHVSKVATSEPIQTKFLGQYMFDSLRFKNMVMVYPDNFQDRRRAELIKKQFNEAAQMASDTNRISPLREVFWNAKDLYGITSKLSTEEENVIIAPSNDQSFVTRLLTSLNMKHNYRFKVIGLSSWEKFENIEISYLHHLNVHLVVSEFGSSESLKDQAFQRAFAENYESIPEKFSYLGYDVSKYYLSLIAENGTNFELMLPSYKQEGLGRKFNFYKTGIESGFENHSNYIIRYQDFHIERVY